MSSAGSLSTMQRLVEQLKLEAAVERIKPCSPTLAPSRCRVCKFFREMTSFPCTKSIEGYKVVSQAAAELQQYCMQNACKDALLVGVPAGSNPFREPRSCTLL
uniref:G protein subunit gamma 10 n=1 Tax=Gallus gallus TaxID=9031 RepID=A0A8V0XS64_CHICK